LNVTVPNLWESFSTDKLDMSAQMHSQYHLPLILMIYNWCTYYQNASGIEGALKKVKILSAAAKKNGVSTIGIPKGKDS
jgi:hypothetical protein